MMQIIETCSTGLTEPSITNKRKSKDDFYDFKSDDESTSQSSIEVEANDYLRILKVSTNILP